jgi:hypothetical protein
MKRAALGLVALSLVSIPTATLADPCADCHRDVTPLAVQDWELSKHAGEGVGCAVCHGDEHTGTDDSHLASGPTAETCSGCHDEQFEQFSRGKHSLAWVAMEAMPTTHALPMRWPTG